MTIAAPGTFGDPRSPSILWRGLEGDLAALSVLQENVESAMESLGFQREKRPFRPHLTLARKYKNSAPFQPQLLEQYRLQAQPLDWDVSGLVLLQTRFGWSPMYEEVQQFVFGLQTPD